MSRLVVREALPSRSLELLTFPYFAVRLRAALMQSYQQSDGYLPPKEVTGGEQERGISPAGGATIPRLHHSLPAGSGGGTLALFNI